MFIVTTRSTVRAVLALACLAAVAGCANVEVWRRPLTVAEPPQPWPRPDMPGELEVDEILDQLLALHNRARKEKRRPRLSESRRLSEAAQAHAEDMAERRKMTHAGADGSTIANRVVARGYKYRRCGENVAVGHYSPELVMRGWLTSAPHRKNILGGYNQIGLGYATDKDGTPYWCVTFGLPATR
ncbi:CAP domain-containing protein [Paludisphaera sp.]|uniref:CAP domain-containing protein n=1 Tax=Paludisphaera sp. TaxID=2017432 RepID=UPI00301DD1CC